MRSFQSIAKVIHQRRTAHPKRYSQSELSHLMGYKNGQFISNVERGLCNIPLKMMKRVAEILDIPHTDLKLAMLEDFERTLNHYLNLKGSEQTHEKEARPELKSDEMKRSA